MKKFKSFLVFLLIFLTTFTSNNVLAMNNNSDLPTIYGKTAITIDVKTGEIIYAKNVDKRMYPASTTKLLTALIFAENKAKSSEIPYTSEAKVQPQYSLNANLHPIAIGETINAQGVMDGLLLFSGNDVAYMIADSVGGDGKHFENLMNKKVKDLGIKNTHFVTPNGLHNDNHYTTAYDLSVIARNAFKNPWVLESSHKKESSVITSSRTKLLIKNRNKLLGENGCIAGKTGYTAKAGRCLAALYERDGRQILGVIMGSIYDAKDSFVFKDMEKIINWSYKAQKTTLHQKNHVIYENYKVNYRPLGFFGPYKELNVPLILHKDATIYQNEVNKKDFSEDFSTTNTSFLALSGKKSIGILKIAERNHSTNYKIYSGLTSSDIIKANLSTYLIILAIIGIILIIIFIIIFIISKLKNGRNKRSNKYWY